MSANLRARLLVACELKEKEARSREGNASPTARGVHRGIGLIQVTPISDRPLTYLALIKKRVLEAMGEEPPEVRSGLECVLAEVEAEALKLDTDARSRGGVPFRVSVDNAEDVRIWAERLGRSQPQLMDAIAHVGTLVEHIKGHLRKSAVKRSS